MTNLYASHLERLVELKQEEANLKIQIAAFQQLAIEEAMTIGKTGTIATINGAKIIFKLMPVKPKPTEEILERQRQLMHHKKVLATCHADKVDSIDCAIKDLLSQKEEILSTEQTRSIEELIQQLTNELQGEMTPQISVTLPKS